MTKPKVSIIVPIHNANIYLRDCLKSLIEQELREIEIILIIDCPTDGSDRIAHEFAQKDSRIKLLYNIENLHTGLSRNKGIVEAQGEYIGFVDHDDYCDKSMFRLLFEAAESHRAEIVRCDFTCVYKGNKEDRVEPYNYPPKTFQIEDKSWILEYVSGNKVSCVIWNHIYKTSFLRDNKLKFSDSRKVCSEDSLFFLDVYLKAQNLSVIPDNLYYHIFHTSNTGRSYNYRSMSNRISFFENLYQYMINKGIGKETIYGYLVDNMAKSLYTGSRQAFTQTSLKKAILDINGIKENDLVMNCFRFLLRKENKAKFKQLKPTVRLFIQVMVSI